MTCNICLEELAIDKIFLPCAHPFHNKCIESWISIKGTRANCPVCRAAIFPNDESQPQPQPQSQPNFYIGAIAAIGRYLMSQDLPRIIRTIDGTLRIHKVNRDMDNIVEDVMADIDSN
jgi:hypothetical protein